MMPIFNLSAGLSLSILTVLLMTTASAQAGTIYKVVDEQTGQVTFTDQPITLLQSDNQKIIKKIIDTQIPANTGYGMTKSQAVQHSSDLNTLNTSGTPEQSTIPNENQRITSSLPISSQSPPNMVITPVSQVGDYRLNIVQPADDRAYRRPTQRIEVTIDISPSLASSDEVVITLDGETVARDQSASLETVNMLPGEHQLGAQVINRNNKVVASASRTIYILQNTHALQKKKQLAEQLMAYERLPWHQKVWLKLRQDNVPINAISKKNTQTKIGDTVASPSSAVVKTTTGEQPSLSTAFGQ